MSFHFLALRTLLALACFSMLSVIPDQAHAESFPLGVPSIVLLARSLGETMEQPLKQPFVAPQ